MLGAVLSTRSDELNAGQAMMAEMARDLTVARQDARRYRSGLRSYAGPRAEGEGACGAAQGRGAGE
jgi:hypothetical protein